MIMSGSPSETGRRRVLPCSRVLWKFPTSTIILWQYNLIVDVCARYLMAVITLYSTSLGSLSTRGFTKVLNGCCMHSLFFHSYL